MRSLKVTQENLDNQRSAVQEEKRLRIDNQPYVPAFLRVDELIFQNHANAHSTIGLMEDLDAATVEDCQEFFRVYYAPNNAVLTIVGDFDPAEARALVNKYFATIPGQPAPPPVDVNEPDEVAVREEMFYDRFAPLPGFIVGWKVPPRRTRDTYAINFAIDLLTDGDSSRLYQKLVKEDESVVQIQGGLDERRGPSAAFIFALPKPGNDANVIREAMMNEIARLANEGPTEEEMLKLRNGLSNDAVRGRQSSLYRAQRLAEYTLYDKDPDLFNTELEIYLNLTAEDVRAAAAKYLATDNRSVLDIVPAAGEGETAPAGDIEEAGEPAQPGSPPPQVPEPPQEERVIIAGAPIPLPPKASVEHKDAPGSDTASET
jgi:predicted Zn-dependent peptidase